MTTRLEPFHETFKAAYQTLEAKFRDQAEHDGSVYLPNPGPTGPVDYVFVAMEPSLGGWAGGSPDLPHHRHLQGGNAGQRRERCS
ncbi:MAG: hypothetical protein CME24_09585 [Gemmatimonadetes bacterium]|uniref:Uncharacterized protein n=1 Tax=marine metagenome TaxID=408172 RepID=A0A382KTT4_9ZZZZ|nr:hypothetical protein [Gemmatimonadota bacterium]